VRRRADEFAVVVVLAWLTAVAAPLLTSVLAPKYRTGVGDQLGSSPLANLAQRAIQLVLVLVCVRVVAGRARSLPTDRRLSLLVLLAPWVYIVARDVYNNHLPRMLDNVIFPVLVVTVWVLRPPLRRLELLGYLVGVTALLCMALALLLPSKGLFSSAGGELITPEKQILPWGVLVGVFSGGNIAGQFLAVGLPAVMLVRRPVHRLWILPATLLALVWTSSRSSIAAGALALAVWAVVAALRAAGAGAASLLASLLALAAVVAIPMTTTTNADFTNRGYIWQASFEYWAHSPWFGLGSTWYSSIGKFVTALPATAYHGHNLFVHSLVIGGVVYIVLLVLLLGVVAGYAATWAARGVAFPASLMVAFLVSGTLEVPFGVVDRAYLFVVTAIPFAVIAFGPLPAAAPDADGAEEPLAATVGARGAG
jgi:O-antigen ligase